MKKLLLIFLIPIIALIVACGPLTGNSVWDYYREYSFKLPFEISRSNFTGRLQFEAEYSFDEMKALIIEAGYDVVRYDFYESTRLLISTEHNNRTVFFVIYNFDASDIATNRFVLDSDLVRALHIRDFRYENSLTWPDARIMVFKNFDYVSNFYYQFGKDVVINQDDQTIDVRAWNINPGNGTYTIITIQFSEDEAGNYFLELTGW
ncbi:MAG: hypothetical protein FWE36_00345 [Erysipelotrichales bacterium]|nr:hypothetical protein [Erysipelotrichales bacterium]